MNYKKLDHETVEIGIKICDFSKQEKGLGTHFLKMLIDYLFESEGYQKIKLDTNLKNKRAQYVYKKLGFQKTNVLIDSWKNQLGELQSSVEYELTKNQQSRFNRSCFTD